MPYRTPSGALYDSGDYEACLDKALELADYDALRARVAAAARRGSARRDRARLHRRAVDLEHGLHHARPDRRRASARRCRSRATPRAPRSRSTRSAGSRCGSRPTPQGQGHRTVCAQVVADVLGCTPDDVTVMSEMDTASVPWTVASGNYSSRFSGVGVGAVQAAALKLRAKIDAIRAHAGDETLSLRRVAGMAHWNPEGLPDGEEPGLAAVAFWAPPTPRPARRGRPRRLVRGARLHRRHLRRRGRARDGRGARARLRHRPRRGPAAQPAARRRSGARRLRPRRGGGALRAARLRRVGQPDDRLARRLPRADRARHPGAADRPPLVDRRP